MLISQLLKLPCYRKLTHRKCIKTVQPLGDMLLIF